MNLSPLARMQEEDAIKKRIKTGIAAVRAQIPLFERLFGRVDSQWKSDRTRVTEADMTISRETEALILQAFPEDQFFSEETQGQTSPVPIDSEFVWIIDPVDGTNNFALGMPMCAISLGLLRDGVPVYGFIYDASRKLILHGGKGFGAFDGETDMCPSIRCGSDELYSAVNGITTDAMFKMLAVLRGKGIRMRNFGSGTLQLAYAANGLLDGSFSRRVSVWDIAASYALCQAVGSEFHFLESAIFPLREFSVKAPLLFYYAGTPHYCRTVERIWKDAGVFPRKEETQS